MRLKKLSQKEMAAYLNQDESTISKLKKRDPKKFRVIYLGILADKAGLWGGLLELLIDIKEVLNCKSYSQCEELLEQFKILRERVGARK